LTIGQPHRIAFERPEIGRLVIVDRFSVAMLRLHGKHRRSGKRERPGDGLPPHGVIEHRIARRALPTKCTERSVGGETGNSVDRNDDAMAGRGAVRAAHRRRLGYTDALNGTALVGAGARQRKTTNRDEPREMRHVHIQ
jgi:hypothetical protein